jgi:hypothetical protein
MIPAATAAPAKTLTERSQKWGQNGSNSPEVKALTYVSIAAILTWSLAALLAFGQLIKSILQRRHKLLKSE